MHSGARSLRVLTFAIWVTACAAPLPSPPADAASPVATLPAIARTSEPQPTQDGRLPIREQVWINSNVVERPGVPEDLRDRYWWTFAGDAGRFGTTAQIGLPASERIETIRDGIIVAARWPVDDPKGALDLVVRAFETGDVVRVIQTPLRTIDAELVGSRLFWTGVLAGDQENVLDGGVWTTEARGGTDPVAIVEPGTAFVGDLCVRGLDASPTRRTLSARAVCKGSRLWTDLIDTQTQTRADRLEKQWVLALTDDTYLLADFEPSEFLELGIGDVGAFDRASGDELWRFPEQSEIPRFASGHWVPLGSSFVTHSYWRTGNAQEVILSATDARTGEQRTLLRQVGVDTTLWATLNVSSAEHLVMTTGWDLSQQIRLDGTSISLLRLDDGTLHENAFEIDPPMLCFEDFCREG
jgi:hypothetical protein